MKTLFLAIFVVFHFGCEFAASEKERNGTNLIALKNQVLTLQGMISDFQYKLQQEQYNASRRVFEKTKKNIRSLTKANQPYCYYAFIDGMTDDLSKTVTEMMGDIPCFKKFKVMQLELENMEYQELAKVRVQIENLSECIETQNRTCEIEINYQKITASLLTELGQYLHSCQANLFEMNDVLKYCIRGFSDSIKDNLQPIMESFENCENVISYTTILKQMSLWPLNLNTIANYTEGLPVFISHDVLETLSPEGIVMQQTIAQRRTMLSNTLLNYTESIRNFLALEKNNGIWDVRDVVADEAKKRRDQVKPKMWKCFNQSIKDIKTNLTAYWRTEIFPRCFYPLQDIHQNMSKIIWHNLTAIELQLSDTLDCENQEVCVQSLRDILKIEVWFNFWKNVNLMEMKDNVKTCLQHARDAIYENIKLFENQFTNCEFVPVTEKIVDKLPRKTTVYLPFLTPDAQLDLKEICPQCDVLDTITDPDYDTSSLVLDNRVENPRVIKGFLHF